MARRFVWPAFVGLVFGLIELARLKAGNYSPSLRQLAEILGIHAALGLVIGLPFVIVASLAMRLLSREEAPGRRQRPLPWRLAALTPAFATLFVMGGIAVNVLYLPARLSPVSLAADLVMLLVVAAAGLAWAHRPWGRSTDAVLVGLVAMAAAGIALWACLPPAGGGR